jgi:hypothetical protein
MASKLAVITAAGQIAIGEAEGHGQFQILPIKALSRHDIRNEAYLPDGKGIVFAAADGAVKLWRLDEEREETLCPPEAEPPESRNPYFPVPQTASTSLAGIRAAG